MNKRAIVTIGISASGKSTWASGVVKENINWCELNRDEIRFAMHAENSSLPFTWAMWDWKNESRVTDEFNKKLESAALNGYNIVVSDTNLNKFFRDQLVAKLEVLGYDVGFKHFDIDYETAVSRDLNRSLSVGSSVIMKQLQQYNNQFGYRYSPATNATPAILVDVDGTVAEMCNRSPYDWGKVGGDSPIEEVLEIINLLGHSHQIIFMSGRDEACRTETSDWLDKHVNLEHDYLLYMRAHGDMRKDSIVKLELFQKHVASSYNVKMVFDDRPQVVRLWNLIGLKTFACANPYIEF